MGKRIAAGCKICVKTDMASPGVPMERQKEAIVESLGQGEPTRTAYTVEK